MTTQFAGCRPRGRVLAWVAASFLVIASLTRLVLLVMAGRGVPLDPLDWLYAFAVGFGYDVVTLLYVALPWALLLWAWPRRWFASRIMHGVLLVLGVAWIFGLLFVAASELVFWNEFGSRFNFIAVDYLVYTREVLGNIEESYPLTTWLSLIAVATVLVVALTRRHLRPTPDHSRFAIRSVALAIWLGLVVVSVAGVRGDMKDQLANSYVDELAGNGIYQFFAAFRDSRLNFDRFYRTLPDAEAWATARAMLKVPGASYVDANPKDLTRAVHGAGAEQHLNVVLISVESLSADFLGAYGASHGHITPNLDALMAASLHFDNLYANGTRTVRGLEALTLSVPPTPGDSLVKQPHDEDLFSLGRVFDTHGYVSAFVYGGYGYFDNMNYFFAHNGYRVVDRRDIPKGAVIHSENVWGVADEDLYTLALGEANQIHGEGKPFFLHIMTTSNHRPFTFPAGRVAEANGTREGAVAYTDWSIADFLRRARHEPWFAATVFVITADHCASSAGRSRIPLDRYHIPLLIYSPAHIAPRAVATLMSQIDIAPTLLGLLDFSYRSRFFGHDIFRATAASTRAFPSTYQRLGYLRGQRLTILAPRREAEQVRPNPVTGDAQPLSGLAQPDLDQAIAAYQVAAEAFRSGAMRWRASDATPVSAAPAATAPVAPAPASGARR